MPYVSLREFNNLAGPGELQRYKKGNSQVRLKKMAIP
jgi:hypothetical protein